MTAVLDPPVLDPGPSPRAIRLALAVGALVVLALLTVTAWMLVPVPTVVPGALSNDGALVVDGDSVGETRLLVPSSGAQALQSVRNEGRVAVTLSAPRTPDLVAAVVGFLPSDSRSFVDTTAEPQETVVVQPGREAGVVLRLTKGCASYAAGSAGTFPDFVVRVAALGKAEEQRVEFRLPVTVTGPHTPGPECAG